MGVVVELQARLGWKNSSQNHFLGRRRSNMATMTAVKKRSKGVAGQSSADSQTVESVAGESVAGKSEAGESKLIKNSAEGGMKPVAVAAKPVAVKTAADPAAVVQAVAVQAAIQAPAEDEQLMVVREYVSRAAQILQSLGTEYERVAWLLEDTLSYLDDADEDEELAFERVRIEEL